MLIIRFKPQGRKYRKQYRIVVAQKHRHVSKLSVDDIGWYNPYSKQYSIDEDKLKRYVELNIAMSDSVKDLLVKNKLISA